MNGAAKEAKGGVLDDDEEEYREISEGKNCTNGVRSTVCSSMEVQQNFLALFFEGCANTYVLIGASKASVCVLSK